MINLVYVLFFYGLWSSIITQELYRGLDLGFPNAHDMQSNSPGWETVLAKIVLNFPHCPQIGHIPGFWSFTGFWFRPKIIQLSDRKVYMYIYTYIQRERVISYKEIRLAMIKHNTQTYPPYSNIIFQSYFLLLQLSHMKNFVMCNPCLILGREKLMAVFPMTFV